MAQIDGSMHCKLLSHICGRIESYFIFSNLDLLNLGVAYWMERRTRLLALRYALGRDENHLHDVQI